MKRPIIIAIVVVLLLLAIGAGLFYFNSEAAKKKAAEAKAKAEQDRLNQIIQDSIPTETLPNGENVIDAHDPGKAIPGNETNGNNAVLIDSAAGRQMINLRAKLYTTNAGVMRTLKNRYEVDAGIFNGITEENASKIQTALSSRYTDYIPGSPGTFPVFTRDEKPDLIPRLISASTSQYFGPGNVLAIGNIGGIGGALNNIKEVFSLQPAGIDYSFFTSDGDPAESLMNSINKGIFNKLMNQNKQQMQIFVANWYVACTRLEEVVQNEAIQSLLAENRIKYA